MDQIILRKDRKEHTPLENYDARTPEQPACKELDDAACYASLFHPSESDRGFLMWIHERLQHVHCDPDLADYMHRLRAIIADMPADKKTVSRGQGKNSLAALQKELSQHNYKLTDAAVGDSGKHK